MSVSPHDLVQLAVELCRSPQPVRRRAAVGRAYYGLFHAGVELLESLGIIVSKGPAGHGELRSRFLNSQDAELTHLGSRLGDLHQLRISADYRLRLDRVEEPKTVIDAVDEAKILLAAFGACHQDSRLAQVAKALGR